MKNSELFQKIYEIAYGTGKKLFQSFQDETLFPNMNDEIDDGAATQDAFNTVQKAMKFYVPFFLEAFSSILAGVISSAFQIKDDADLTDYDTIEKLSSEIEE